VILDRFSPFWLRRKRGSRLQVVESIQWFIGDKILILGDDFNCVENKSIDKIGDVGWSILSSFQNNYRLVDAYRVSDPRDIATT